MSPPVRTQKRIDPMSEEWLIDGYNLLYSLKPRGKKIKITKDALFARLSGFASAIDKKVLLVLDGIGREEEWGPSQTRLFRIVYSQDVSADTVIERAVTQSKHGTRFTVVTNDVVLSRMARGKGACVIRTEDFEELLSRTEKESREGLFKREAQSHGFHRPFEKKL